MTTEAFGKHMVWTEHPTTKLQLGIGYSSFKEAEHESVKLEQAGYKILKITPTTLPIPGTLSLEHLRENLAALQIELTDAEFEELGARQSGEP